MTSLGNWIVSARKSFPVLGVAALAAAGLTAITTGGAAGAAAAHTGRHHHAAPIAPGSGAAGDEPTVSQNDLRDGWDPNEPALTPAAVHNGSFGQIFKTSVNGEVYSQPLVVGNTLIVSTENDWVYGLNATTGKILWSRSLGKAYHITSCDDLTPNIGITSTGVYDPTTGSVYVMALVHEINWSWHLFGLNVSTGAVTLKQRIAGSPANDPHLSFSALPEDNRPGLLLLNGWVYTSFASHCDHGSYNGYVAGVDVEQRPVKTTLWADEAGVSNEKGGIWQSGGGVMSDGPGRIFVTSGNGISPPPGPGDAPGDQLAESVIRLAPNPTTGALTAQDFFSPANAPSLDASDTDYGSSGPTGLPFGTSTYPDILMEAGKFGTIYLLNRDNLGGREQGPGKTDEDLDLIGPIAGQFGHPAFFADTPALTTANAPGSHDYMVFVGKSDYLREFQAGVGSSGKPTLPDVNNSTFILGYTSGAPAITSNGTDPATGLIWEVHDTDKTGANAIIGAWGLEGVPRAGGGTKLREYWSASIGTASQFTNIATANGMVYAGTRDGDVYGFGITSGGPLKRSGTAQFRDTPAGSATTRHVSVTATRTVTVTGASVSAATTPAPFTVGRVTLARAGGTPARVKFPVTLHKGDVLRAAVKFAPAAAGGVDGQISFTTAASAVPVSVPLIANGIRTGLFATTPAMSFKEDQNDGMVITNVPVGITLPQVTDIVNDGSRPVTVKSVKPPTGSYTATNLPKVGTVIKPGEAIPVDVVFAPRHAVTTEGSFTITPNRGTSVTVSLTGTGLPAVSKFTAEPAIIKFGPVRVGHTGTQTVEIIDEGNQTAIMGRTGLPGRPFGAPLRAPDGLPVNQGYELVLPVTFHPAKAGSYHGTYTVTWTDRFGKHSLTVPVTGTGVGQAAARGRGAWPWPVSR
jgi:outer membrane protein assembly factor BamB